MAGQGLREVAESNRGPWKGPTYRQLEQRILYSLGTGPLSLRSISDITSQPYDRCAHVLRSLIRQEKVIPVRERTVVVYELIPGSITNWVLDHEV